MFGDMIRREIVSKVLLPLGLPVACFLLCRALWKGRATYGPRMGRYDIQID